MARNPVCPSLNNFKWTMSQFQSSLRVSDRRCIWGNFCVLGEQGWRSGESAHLPPMCPGLNSRFWRHMWVEFVVGSLLYSEGFFSAYSGFPDPSPNKPTFPNSNSIRIIVKLFIMSLWLGWLRKHSLCLTLVSNVGHLVSSHISTEAVRCEHLVSPAPNERETISSNRSFLWDE